MATDVPTNEEIARVVAHLELRLEYAVPLLDEDCDCRQSFFGDREAAELTAAVKSNGLVEVRWASPWRPDRSEQPERDGAAFG